MLNKLLFLTLFLTSFAHAKSILYLGDSQSYGAMGTMMAEDFEKGTSLCLEHQAPEDEVTLLAVVGSSPRHWGDTQKRPGMGDWLCKQKMKQYQTGKRTVHTVDNPFCDESIRNKTSVLAAAINQINPDMVVFQFLGNSSWIYTQAMQLPADQREAYLERTIKTYLASVLEPVGNRECLFMTSNPVHISKLQAIKQRQQLQAIFKRYIAEINPNCQFLAGNTDASVALISHNATHFQRDKVHLTAKGGRVFVDYIKGLRCQLE